MTAGGKNIYNFTLFSSGFRSGQFSVGANCEFMHLVDLQIPVKVYTQAIKQGVHRDVENTPINFAILNSSFIKNDNLAMG